MTSQVRWTQRALKDVERLDRRTRERIVEGIERFAATGQGDMKRLQGTVTPKFRLRIGDWRVLFQQEKEVIVIIVVLRVLPRGSAYQP